MDGPTQDLLQDWIDKWETGKTGWKYADSQYNPLLIKHADSLINSRNGIKVLVPLCGDNVDMKWFHDQGHTVVGIEASAKAVELFFERHNMEFTKEEVKIIDGFLYKSNDGRIRIYCCDFFNFKSEVESGLQGVWDRASLIAVNVDDRIRYVALLKTLLAADCRYLLVSVDYDPENFKGPPHCIRQPLIEELFGTTWTVTKLDTREDIGNPLEIEDLYENLYLLHLKTNENN